MITSLAFRLVLWNVKLVMGDCESQVLLVVALPGSIEAMLEVVSSLLGLHTSQNFIRHRSLSARGFLSSFLAYVSVGLRM